MRSMRFSTSGLPNKLHFKNIQMHIPLLLTFNNTLQFVKVCEGDIMVKDMKTA